MLISLKQAYLGGVVTKKMIVQVPCSTCSGLGRTGGECVYCKGMGYSQTAHKRHFANTDICEYCMGTGFTDRCSDCSGKGLKTDVQDMSVNVPPGTPEGAILRQNNPGLHQKVQIRISVPPNYKVFPGKILYTPSVELIDVIKGYTLDVLGEDIEIPPYTFKDININDSILVRPNIIVSNRELFDTLVTNGLR